MQVYLGLFVFLLMHYDFLRVLRKLSRAIRAGSETNAVVPSPSMWENLSHLFPAPSSEACETPLLQCYQIAFS